MPRIGYQHKRLKSLVMLASGKISWLNVALNTDYLIQMYVTGDTYPRFRIRVDGRLDWGGGAGALDVTMDREIAGRLTNYDNFAIADGYLYFTLGAVADNAIISRVVGATQHNLIITRNGEISWGSGAAVVDCVLSRRAANILNTPDRMEVGSLGVANSAGGDVTATSADYKVQVFDAAGNSLGYLQVYAG